jgi:phage terminase large subunit
MILKPNPYEKFRILYEGPPGIYICIGGRGGMKSYETAKWASVRLISDFHTRGVLIRDEATTVKNSILNDVKNRFQEIDTQVDGYFSQVYSLQEDRIKNKIYNHDAIFTIGIKDSSSYQSARLKSLSDVDFTIMEEAEDVRDEEKVFKLFDSIRKPNFKHIINLNVPDKNHWIIRRFFNLVESPFEGYYDIVPKKGLEDVHIIQTSYKDNKYLPDSIVKRYEQYGNPESEFYNPDYYYQAILGLVSEGMKGRVFKYFEPCSTKEFDELPYESYYGLDWGFENDPTALVEVKRHNRKVWAKERLYRTHMTNHDIIKELKELGVSYDAKIVADAQEPKSIAELKKAGFNITRSRKGHDSIIKGIDTLNSLNVFYTEDSLNLETEILNYTYKESKDGKMQNKTIDEYNHGLDSLRYITTYIFQKDRDLVV